MKQKIGIAGIYLLGALAAQAGNYTVKSPDGKLAVNVSCEGGKGLLSSIKRFLRRMLLLEGTFLVYIL